MQTLDAFLSVGPSEESVEPTCGALNGLGLTMVSILSTLLTNITLPTFIQEVLSTLTKPLAHLYEQFSRFVEFSHPSYIECCCCFFPCVTLFVFSLQKFWWTIKAQCNAWTQGKNLPGCKFEIETTAALICIFMFSPSWRNWPQTCLAAFRHNWLCTTMRCLLCCRPCSVCFFRTRASKFALLSLSSGMPPLEML